MRVVADTNVLLRAMLDDDLAQKQLAMAALAQADLIAIPTAVFCELVWVLSRSYRLERADIVAALRTLLASSVVRVDDAVVQAGLAALERGGDFADGAIVIEGRLLGGEVLMTFDRKAARLHRADGGEVALLA